MAEFDLTLKYCEYLDLHLTFPLFEILLGKETYDKNELVKFILETTTKTNVSDYSIQIRNRFQTGLDMIPELNQRKKQTLERLKELKQPLHPVITMAKLKINEIKDSKKLLNFLQAELKSDLGDIPDKFYELGKGSYDAGLYEDAAIELFFCLLWMPPTHKNYLNALWGKVAAETLSCNWSMALEDLIKLREFIDNHNFTNIEGLQQRAWWIHWSNMVFFNHPKGRDLIIEIFLYKPLYLNAIQTMCPHMLRYLATALIINRNRRNALKDLIKVIQQEANNYRDPITEFLECLYVNFDFDGARMKLHECHDVIGNDFFIFQFLDVFVENARLMIFETFCRIHQCITISMLADKLNMDPDEAERWIVNLIRNARLDAKIDSKLGHVVMGTQPLSPYQQLVEKVDSLSVRSEHLTGLVERKHKAKNSDSISNWNYYN